LYQNPPLRGTISSKVRLARLRKELDSTAREIARRRAQIDARWEFIKRLAQA